MSLLAAVLAIIWLTTLRPAWTMLTEPYRRVTQLSESIEAYRTAAVAGQDLELELASLRSIAPSAQGLILADNAALAAARLQSDVRAIVEHVDGRIHSAQNLAPESEGSYERISLRYELSVPMGRLSDLLRAVESHVPLYFVDQVLMRAPDRAGSGGVEDTDLVMQIRWTIYAYRWVDDTWLPHSH